MNKDLVVILKAHGIGTIVMNLPVVSKIIHARENDEVEFLDVIYTISDELDRVGIAELVEEDVKPWLKQHKADIDWDLCTRLGMVQYKSKK